MLAGMLGLCAGRVRAARRHAPRYLGLPALLVGGVLCAAGLVIGGRRVPRTRYRPDPWRRRNGSSPAVACSSAVLLFVSTGFTRPS